MDEEEDEEVGEEEEEEEEEGEDKTGSIMAEDPEVKHYHLKNSSICLRVKKTPPYNNVQWLKAENVITSPNTINPKYINKVRYDPENLTLCIYNLIETDSDVYKVSFFDSDFKQFTETHRVVVQDVVPRPVIKMSVLHSNLSAGLCNITVNCSIQEDWVWSVCNEDRCKTSQKSLSKVNISIFTDNSTVVCSGSNHVSTSNVSENMEATCFNKSYPDHNGAPQPSFVFVIVIVLVIVACVMLCTFIVCRVKKCSLLRENNHHQTQTSNAQLTQNQPVETQPQGSPQRPRVSFSTQADVTYENVDDTRSSQTSNPTIRSLQTREESRSKQSQKADTVYSFLQVPTVMASLGKSDSSKDTKGCKKITGAPASPSVPMNEAAHTMQIDTLQSTDLCRREATICVHDPTQHVCLIKDPSCHRPQVKEENTFVCFSQRWLEVAFDRLAVSLHTVLCCCLESASMMWRLPVVNVTSIKVLETL
ncbi:hypothetical protein PAMP_015863 [Pampus punctatissimus]